MKVEFYKHNIDAKDRRGVLKVLQSVFLTTGEWTSGFERKLVAYTKNQYAVGLMSCTHALELALRYFGIHGGDEVITTPMSFIATANVIESVGARPVFVDVEASTGNMDVSLIESAITKKTRAILPVHLYGQMCDMKKIREIADRHHLKVIEDAAHCIEGMRDGIRVGQLGDVACYSFYATKNITSGEGGAIACNDEAMYEWMIKARQHGMSKQAADRYTGKYEHYDMDFLGAKCNMSNIQAAMLVNQIDRIEALLNKKAKIAAQYDSAFARNTFMSIPVVLPNTKHARHLYTIWVNPLMRDVYMHKLQEAGIGVAVNFRSIHLMQYYQKKYGFCRGMFKNAERIGDSTISIPLYPKLTPRQIKYVHTKVNGIITV